MGKQKKILHDILRAFELIQENCHESLRVITSEGIQGMFLSSLNKRALTRRILFDALLSDDDVLKLLRIIFDKEKK